MSGQLVLTGRAKDTLVLSGGENVAPAPVEDALCRSPLLEHAMLVGHDRRTLGVLVCLAEDELRLRMEVRALLPPPPPRPLATCPHVPATQMHVLCGEERRSLATLRSQCKERSTAQAADSTHVRAPRCVYVGHLILPVVFTRRLAPRGVRGQLRGTCMPPALTSRVAVFCTSGAERARRTG